MRRDLVNCNLKKHGNETEHHELNVNNVDYSIHR